MNLLKYGDTIGIISPSWVADPNDYKKYAEGIERLGFQVKFGKNIYKDTYKYTASISIRSRCQYVLNLYRTKPVNGASNGSVVWTLLR